MFRSKIVFVLGAGASHEVKLPVGADLKKKIAQKLDMKLNYIGHLESGDTKIWNAIQQHVYLSDDPNGESDRYLSMCQILIQALPLDDSIDNLLDKHRGNNIAEICGKLGIVSSILDAERASTLCSRPTSEHEINFSNLDQTWFVAFLKLLTKDVPREQISVLFSNVSFISFNYDRCSEHFLHESLQIQYSSKTSAVTEAMSALQILHPYGSVGKLPWQETQQSSGVPFGSESSQILATAKQIKTFNESVSDDQEIATIRAVIQSAEIVVFLGFAFHEQNIKLITPTAACKAKRVYATAYGISPSNCNVIRGELERMLQQGDAKASIELRSDLKCADLLTEYSRSLTASV